MLWQIFDLTFLIRFLTAIVGTIGFALIFRSRLRYLPLLAIGGGVTYAIYHVVAFFGAIFGAAFAASFFFACYCEIFARIKRAPAIIFMLPCAIPIVPGSSLYYGMENLISRDFATAAVYFEEALMVGIGIAGGILVVSILMNVYNGIILHLKQRKQERDSK